MTIRINGTEYEGPIQVFEMGSRSLLSEHVLIQDATGKTVNRADILAALNALQPTTPTYRANFLYGVEDELDKLGYEFANGQTEEYLCEVWGHIKESLNSLAPTTEIAHLREIAEMAYRMLLVNAKQPNQSVSTIAVVTEDASRLMKLVQEWVIANSDWGKAAMNDVLSPCYKPSKLKEADHGKTEKG